MMSTNFDFTNVQVKEFQPRIFKKSELCEHDLTTTMKAGRIERSKCSKCDYDVWS